MTYRVRLADLTVRQVAGMGIGDISPSVAGGRMVFVRQSSGYRGILRAPGRLAEDPGAPLRPIVDHRAFDGNHSISSDGQRIAFESCATGRNQVWVANIDGTGQQPLTDMDSNASSPSWSPDGQYIMFDSTDSGNSDVWAISVDGGEPWRLTDSERQDLGSGFSPDGESIFITSDRNGSDWQIYAVPFPGGEADGEVRPITRGGGVYGFADHEGRYFYYNPSEMWTSIWRVPISGGVEQEILPGPIRFWPRWSLVPGGIYYEGRDADGSAIYYFDLETQESLEVFRGAAIWLRVSPDEKHMILGNNTGQASSELWMIENFR